MSTPLPRSVRVGYSLGSFTSGAFGTVPGLLLLPYLTDSLGVAAALAGTLVLLPKVWDVLFSPLAGRFSDRATTRIGPRRPFVLWGGIGTGILFILMFSGVLGTSAGAPAWVFITFILCGTAYALFSVPYLAMPAEMTGPGHERTRLLTLRVAISAVAILVSGGAAPIIAHRGSDSIAGYREMGIVIGTLILVGAIGSFFGTRRAPIGNVDQKDASIVAQLRVAAQHKPFLALLVCFILQGAGIATILASVDYFATYVLHSGIAPTLLFVAFIAPAIIFMPLWSRVGKRIGIVRGYVVVSLTFSLGGVLIAVVAAAGANPLLEYLAVAVAGCGYAGQQVFSLALLAECIGVVTNRTGKTQGGVLSGLWSAGDTFGAAFGPGIFGLFLQFSGYISTTAGHTVVQPDSVVVGVVLGTGLAPALLMAIGLIMIRWYRQEVEQEVREIPPLTEIAGA